MPNLEKTTPQIRKVFELLVKQHPNYDHFIEKNGWGYAYKVSETAASSNRKTEIIYKYKYVSLLPNIVRKLMGKQKGIKPGIHSQS